MEAIAVVGGVSAVLSIALEFGKMGGRLHKLAKTIYHAQKEVQDISKEVLNFSRILRMLDETLESAQNAEIMIGRSSAKRQLVDELVNQIRPLLKEFRRLRKKLKPLKEGQSSNAFRRLIAGFQWSLNKSSTTYLRRVLDSHKITLNLLIVTIILGERIAECKRCEERGENVPEKLKMKIEALRQELRREKKECRRAKAELEHLQRQHPGVGDTPTSAEHFTQKVLELATRQQEVERRQREQQTSIASSSEYRSPEYSNLSSDSRASEAGSGHFRDTGVAGKEIIRIRQSSSSPSATRESSPHTPIQCRRPAGSVPTALFGDSREHHRNQLAPPIVGPVIHDDGDQVHVVHRQWRTRRGGHESNSSSVGYDSSGYGSSVASGS